MYVLLKNCPWLVKKYSQSVFTLCNLLTFSYNENNFAYLQRYNLFRSVTLNSAKSRSRELSHALNFTCWSVLPINVLPRPSSRYLSPFLVFIPIYLLLSFTPFFFLYRAAAFRVFKPSILKYRKQMLKSDTIGWRFITRSFFGFDRKQPQNRRGVDKRCLNLTTIWSLTPFAFCRLLSCALAFFLLVTVELKKLFFFLSSNVLVRVQQGTWKNLHIVIARFYTNFRIPLSAKCYIVGVHSIWLEMTCNPFFSTLLWGKSSVINYFGSICKVWSYRQSGYLPILILDGFGCRIYSLIWCFQKILWGFIKRAECKYSRIKEHF